MTRSDLDDFFSAARAQEMPGTLQGRLLAEAERLQPAPRDIEPRSAGGAGVTVRELVASVLGGWRGAYGLSAALAAGLWIGFADPAGLLADLTSIDTIDLLPASSGLLAGYEEG